MTNDEPKKIDFETEHKEPRSGHCLKCDKRVPFGDLVCQACIASLPKEKK